jgi:hypothetical protein
MHIQIRQEPDRSQTKAASLLALTAESLMAES